MADNSVIFQKLGGKYQLVMDKPDDLLNIDIVDEAHWMGTSAPCDAFACDPQLLKHLDTDGNSRVRTDEVKKARAWLFKMLADRSRLCEQSDTLSISAIDSSHPEGQALKSAAELIVKNLEAENTEEISLAQTRSRKQILSGAACNGDGIIPQERAQDEGTQKLIQDIMDTVGSVEDASGKKGANAELTDKFQKLSVEYLEWVKKGRLTRGHHSSTVLVWGHSTEEAYKCISVVEKKIDDFFSLCALLRLDRKIEQAFSISDEKLKELDISNRAQVDACIEAKPLAPPNAEESLFINENINTAYREKMDKFKEVALSKFKKDGDASTLTLSEWKDIKKLFAEYSGWFNEKKGAEVEKIGEKALAKYLSGPEIEKLKQLIEEDKAVADEVTQIENLEKLILFHKLFMEFVNNFISFNRLFDPRAVSMIQIGNLVIDERRFDLVVKVKDRAAHKKVAMRSNICIMYLTVIVRNGDKDEKMDIATAVTSGFTTNLYVGKRGIFVTPDGKTWDAEIVDFIQQPVSLSEALRMPFKKLGEFLGKQADRFTSTRYKNLETGVGKSINNAENSLVGDNKKPAGSFWTNGPMLMLGGGVGLAALGSAFAFIVKTFKSVSILNVLAVFAGILAIVAIPVIVMALFKLRQRNIGMFLEACGWSINSRMRLSCKLGLLFTYTPDLPANSKLKRADLVNLLAKNTLMKKKRSWRIWLWLAIALIIGGGIIYISRIVRDIDHNIPSAISEKKTVGSPLNPDKLKVVK